MGLHIINGGIRSTTITAMESMSGLHSLHERRKEKVLIQAEKYKRLETHPMNQKIQEPNINRLEPSSFKHLSKQLSNENQYIISKNPEEWEILTPYSTDEEENQDITVYVNIAGIETKAHQSVEAQKALTLEHLSIQSTGFMYTQMDHHKVQFVMEGLVYTSISRWNK